MVVRHLFGKGIRMRPKQSEKRKTALEITVDNALDYLRRRRYRPKTIKNYRRSFNALLRFARKYRQTRLTESLLEKYRKRRTNGDSREILLRQNIAMRVLWEFHRHGVHRLKRTKPRPPLAPYFERELKALDLYCRAELGWSRENRRCNSGVWRLFLEYTGQRRALRNWNSLHRDDFFEYLRANAHLARSTRKRRMAALRALTRIVFVFGKLRRPLHDRLPRVSRSGCNPPPSLWTRAEFEKMLTGIDRSVAIGLRDYAILLVAGRLGLRSGDIGFLRIDDLLWDERIIELTQRKTGKPIRLPLLPDVGDAIVDYLRNGRPPSDAPELFIRHRAPWGRLGRLSNIARSRQIRAGITPILHRSVHALRHTLATGLLIDDVPLPTIAASLGHRQARSTYRYLVVAPELMGQAALEVEWKEAAHVW